MTTFMVPLPAFLYNRIGIVPLFLINMGSFLIAAVMENRIKAEEAYVKKDEESFGFAQYKKTFTEGIRYLKNERGLLTVYIIGSLIEGTVLYLPLYLMMAFCFVEGILGVTSYNIRISATQSYVPDEKKGRFNGIFQMATTTGLLSGQLLAGVFTVWLPERAALSGFMAVSLLSAIFIIGGNRKYVKKIYNRRA